MGGNSESCGEISTADHQGAETEKSGQGGGGKGSFRGGDRRFVVYPRCGFDDAAGGIAKITPVRHYVIKGVAGAVDGIAIITPVGDRVVKSMAGAAGGIASITPVGDRVVKSVAGAAVRVPNVATVADDGRTTPIINIVNKPIIRITNPNPDCHATTGVVNYT